MASSPSPPVRDTRPGPPAATDGTRAGGARWYLAGVAILTLVAAALRLPTLDASSLWFDEAVTLSLLRMDLGDTVAQIPRSESTPPLYYVTAWLWTRALGETEVMVRALSALAGIVTVPVLYAAGARLATRRVGLIAAALAAVSPLLVWHSQDARAYALLVLLCAVSLLAFARALAAPTARRLAAWALAAALALLTHYFAVFLVAGEAVWLLVRHRGRRSTLAAAAVPLLVGAALLPLAVAQRTHGGASWLAERELGARLESLWPHLLAGYGAAPGPLASYESGSPPGLTIAAAALAGAGLVLAVLVAVGRQRGGGTGEAGGRGEGEAEGASPERTGDAEPGTDGRERLGLLVAATLAAACLGVPVLLGATGLDYVFTRNLLPLWLVLALVVAIGLGSRRAGWLGPLLAVGLCGVLAAVTVTAAASPRFGPDSWLSVARGLGGPGSDRVVMAPASIAMPLALERPGLATLPAAGKRVTEIVLLRRGAVERRSPASGFRLVERRTLGDSFTLFRFRSRTGAALVTPSGLLGDLPVRRRRTAVLFAPSVTDLGRGRFEPPTISFCAPPPGDARARISIRTPCAEAYPR